MHFWSSLFRKRAVDQQLDSELAFHVDALTQEKIAAGLAPAEARRQALVEFGGREQVKEELRDVHRIATIENTLANLKSAVRFMRKSPSFSVAVILTLALAIGANSAVFSAIDAILLRPLPFPHAAQLVSVRQYDTKVKGPFSFVAPIRVEDWNRLNSVFQAVAGYYPEDATETSGPLPEKLTRAWITPRFLQVMGVFPSMGRDFTSQEQRFGGPHAVVISHRLWVRRFHSDPATIGKSLRFGTLSETIVGIMPASFSFPDRDIDLWSPSPPDAPFAQSRKSTWYQVVARLKPGVTLPQARANLASVQVVLGRQFPETDTTLAIDIEPLKTVTLGHVGNSLWLLFASVSLLLLIACTNVAALLLARAVERQREISVRFSLGASRASVVAQLLTECLVLSLAGSALGLFLAAAALRTFRALARALPRADEITLDWRIVLYTLVCAVLATLLCGLFPAIRATRRSIAEELAHSGRAQVSTRNPLQWLLVAVQVALAVTLLVGAGLLLRSFQALGQVSPGFNPAHVLTFHITGNYAETVNYPKMTARINRTLAALQTLPGVEAAATSGTLPGVPERGQIQTEVKLEGRPDTAPKVLADSRFVSQNYFATLAIPLLAGAACPEALDLKAAVVNRSFAETYLSGSSVLDRHVAFVSDSMKLPPTVIVGIVADAREDGLNREPAPTVYWCLSSPEPDPHYLVRTRGNPLALAPAIRHAVHQIEPARSVFDLSPLEEHLRDSFGEDRLRTLLLTLFAASAFALASVGLYGTLSYFVTVRRREVGLRLALGAGRGEIVRRFLVQGVSISLGGCVAGLTFALALTRLLRGMLYAVSPLDPATFSLVALLVFVVAALASLLPSIRAARVEPMNVLRDE